MKRIIFLSFFCLCILSIPCYAWDAGFEGHPSENNDILDYEAAGLAVTTSQEAAASYSLLGSQHGYNIYGYIPKGQVKALHVNDVWDGQVSFTGYSSCPDYAPGYVGLRIYNASGGVVFEDTQMTTLYDTGYIRYEFIETGSGNGIDVYQNGILIDSTAFSSTPGTFGEYDITIYSPSSAPYVIMDDFTDSPQMSVVSTDSSISTADSYQYFRVGYPVLTGGYWFAKTYDPNGYVINTQNITSFRDEFSIPKSNITESGTYSIKLFYHADDVNSDFYYTQKTFIFDKPSGMSVSLDKEEYRPADQMTIFSYMPTYSSGYKVTVAGTTTYTYDVLSADYTKRYTLPTETLGGTYFVYLRDPNDDVVAYDYFYVSAPLGTTSLTLDKTTYEKNDTIKVYYKNMPEDTRIDLYLKSGSTKIFTTNLLDAEGSGVFTCPIEGRAADSVYVKATQGDVFEGTVLAEVTAKILSGNGFISGKVYDSSTNTPVSGATIYIGGSSDVTDALGYYEMTTLMGTQPVSIIKDGYNQLTGNVQIYSLSTSKNFYLVKTILTGSNTLYGTVTDYYTGAPLNNTYIQIKNGSTTYSMLTHSKTGNYLFDQEGLAGSWDVTVTKTGYDTHTQTVTISGDTYLSIKLVPTGGSSSVPEDDSSSSGSSDSSTDRPGREAARDSMEQFEALAPALIALVVIKVIRELMK